MEGASFGSSESIASVVGQLNAIAAGTEELVRSHGNIPFANHPRDVPQPRTMAPFLERFRRTFALKEGNCW